MPRAVSTTGEAKPFTCPICGVGFGWEINRDNHVIQFHENSGIYKCTQCDKRFPFKSQLDKHEELHSVKDRPFVCDLCGYTFKLLRTLNSHKTVRHMVKQAEYDCPECEKKFAWRTGLANHIRLVHAGQWESTRQESARREPAGRESARRDSSFDDEDRDKYRLDDWCSRRDERSKRAKFDDDHIRAEQLEDHVPGVGVVDQSVQAPKLVVIYGEVYRPIDDEN